MARTKIRLSDIVNSYMAGRDHEDYDSYVSYENVVQRGRVGLREMSRFIGGSNIKSVRLEVTNSSVDFPVDFMNYTKIGFYDENGNVTTLGRNDDMNISQDILLDSFDNPLLDSDGYYLTTKTPSNAQTPTGINNEAWANGYYWLNFYYGNDVYNTYGVPAGNNRYGYYKVDWDNNRIEFSSSMTKTHIILEYVSDPTMMEDPLVDQRLEKAIRSWIFWKNVERKSNVPEVEKRRAKAEFKAQRKVARSQIKSFTIKEAVSALRAGNKQVKF